MRFANMPRIGSMMVMVWPSIGWAGSIQDIVGFLRDYALGIDLFLSTKFGYDLAVRESYVSSAGRFQGNWSGR
jgi:hypothetical protein